MGAGRHVLDPHVHALGCGCRVHKYLAPVRIAGPRGACYKNTQVEAGVGGGGRRRAPSPGTTSCIPSGFRPFFPFFVTEDPSPVPPSPPPSPPWRWVRGVQPLPVPLGCDGRKSAAERLKKKKYQKQDEEDGQAERLRACDSNWIVNEARWAAGAGSHHQMNVCFPLVRKLRHHVIRRRKSKPKL